MSKPYITKDGIVEAITDPTYLIRFRGLDYEGGMFIPDPRKILENSPKKGMGFYESTSRGDLLWFIEIDGVKYVKIR